MSTIKEDGVASVGGSPTIPTNNASDGTISGIGMPNKNLPNQAEPGVKKGQKNKVMTFKEFLRRELVRL